MRWLRALGAPSSGQASCLHLFAVAAARSVCARHSLHLLCPPPALPWCTTWQIWDIEAKKAILEEWDPEEKRGYDNFNPFERDSVGNACDTNGKFPGETAYKDPIRADTSFAQMQAAQGLSSQATETA